MFFHPLTHCSCLGGTICVRFGPPIPLTGCSLLLTTHIPFLAPFWSSSSRLHILGLGAYKPYFFIKVKMKILSWNIQGGKKLHALGELIYVKNKVHSDILFILETLLNAHNRRKILKALHFDKMLIIDPVNHCGGIWVC